MMPTTQVRHEPRCPGRVFPATLLLLAGLSATVFTDASGQDRLGIAVDDVIESGRIPWARWPDFSRHVDDVRRLYATYPGGLLWFDGWFISQSGRAAVALLRTAEQHGFDPHDYDAETLDHMGRRSVRKPLDGVDRVRFDLLLTVNLIRFLHDLRFGRLHPGTFDRNEPESDLAEIVLEALAGDSVARLASAIAPRLAQYRKLQQLLSRYRMLARDSSFLPLPATVPLPPGSPYEAVSHLRRRLVATGDLLPNSPGTTSDLYGDLEAEAVRRFQSRHSLPPDGVLDAATVAELNVPFQRRVRQIELALERLRWLPPIEGQRFIVVNIPAFQLFTFDSAGGSGAPSLQMRVIVGQALDTRTPMMLEQLRYVEFRPYWNVPRTILINEIVPLVKRNPSYLRENGMEIVGQGDRVIGDVVQPETLEQLARGELRIRQRPGAHNAMGLTKFVFPNSASVYLHGTPQTELFSHTRRDFSHGCIRVEDPTALAAWVLRDQPSWPRSRIATAQEGGSTTRVWLTDSLPVIVFYTTAVAAPDGRAWFYTDIYGHDRELDKALRAPPVTP